MKNAVIFTLLLLCAAGCQTVPETGASQLSYFKTLLPGKKEKKNKTAETENGVSEVPPRPAEYKTARHPLYKPGSILPSPVLVDEQFIADVSEVPEMSGDTIADTQTSQPPPALELKPETQFSEKLELKESAGGADVLQAEKNDSETLRQLLGEIAATPKEERKVGDAELAELIGAFRSSMDWEDEPELEIRYLAALRRKILPVKKTVNAVKEELADIDTAENTAEEEPSTYQSRTKKNRTADTTVAGSPYPPLVQLPEAQPVVSASYVASQFSRTTSPPMPDAPYGADWETTAKIAVEQLRQTIAQTPTGKTFGNEARLRLLELALNNRSEAAKAFSSADKPVNEFWGNQILGLAAFLDETGMPETKVRYAATAFRLDEGLMELRKVCPVKLKNVQFVRDVQAFGFYLSRSEECKSGETVMVYMELENPTIRRTGQGYNVAVSMSYEILDATGNVLEKVNNIAVECTTPGPRRDHFVNLKVSLPKTLQTGSHQLRLNVTDTNNESLDYAEEQIPFKIVPSADANAAGGRPGTKPMED
ncbi:MAG: hypothetical protein LBN39_11940 [Planctomycetaceae bacterium]|jgi:hypothetical protein|nr:hypothetical protein [Planctomycetaceae bacterium]